MIICLLKNLENILIFTFHIKLSIGTLILPFNKELKLIGAPNKILANLNDLNKYFKPGMAV
jgi:hypothetical protein